MLRKFTVSIVVGLMLSGAAFADGVGSVRKVEPPKPLNFDKPNVIYGGEESLQGQKDYPYIHRNSEPKKITIKTSKSQPCDCGQTAFGSEFTGGVGVGVESNWSGYAFSSRIFPMQRDRNSVLYHRSSAYAFTNR